MDLLPEDFEDKLKTKVIGHPLYIYSRLDSTQLTAKKMAEHGAEEGATVFAYSQNKGIGKNGRRWYSPRGGIWLTIILRPSFSLEKANLINIVFATACSEALYSFGNLEPVIKWPNDILIKGRKICGILTQIKGEKNNKIDYALTGIGINVDTEEENFPRELMNKTTSLKKELKEDIDYCGLLACLLEKMEEYYLALKKNKFLNIRKRWGNFSPPFGSLIKASTKKDTHQGQLVGTNEYGHLIIRNSHGTLEEVPAGEVEFIG